MALWRRIDELMARLAEIAPGIVDEPKRYWTESEARAECADLARVVASESKEAKR